MVENARSLNIVAGIILGIDMLYILGPLYISLVTATQSFDSMLSNGISLVPGGDFINNARFIFTQTRIPVQVANSLIVAVGDALGTCIFSFLAAYAIVYFRSRWSGIAFALILVTIMLPLDIRVITTYQAASNVLSPINAVLDLTGVNGLLAGWLGAPVALEWNILDTHLGLVLPLLAHGTGTFLFCQFFRTMPADLVKAARIDGAGPIRFLVDVLMPLSMTPFAALFVLSFLSGWTQYLWPLVAGNSPEMQTAVVGIARLNPGEQGTMPNFPVIMTGVVIVSVIPLAMILMMQRFLVRGLVLSEK